MLNTSRLQTVVSPRVRDDLLAVGLLRQDSPRVYRLSGTRIAGEPLPDLAVRASPGPAVLGVEGMLGLDFLNQFGRVCLENDTLRLTLTHR